ncbi:AAA family ATPase [Nanoarchaeota archaeon]
MQLRSIKIKNIRSYSNQDINFPLGSTLLSGDIGSGKSSILHAIEFAIFGIKRGDLSGSMLLAHGKKEGFVELTIKVDNKDIIIKRTLKRSKDDVKQDSGYIIINGQKKECSPVELKAEILTLLGYPKDIISKPKDYLFRYTVYTPQEEMKSILTESKEVRLDTLRRVFNIDKYKNIATNASILIRDLKERKKIIETKVSNYSEILERKQKLELDLESSKKLLEKIIPKKELITTELKGKREQITNLEKDIKFLIKTKQEFATLEVELSNLIKLKRRGLEDLTAIEKELSQIKTETIEPTKINVHEERRIKEGIVNELDNKTKDIVASIGQIRATISLSETTKKKIQELNNCPVCLQNVNPDHKKSIINREDSKIKDINEILQENEKKLKDFETQFIREKKNLDEIRKMEAELAVIESKQRTIKNLEERSNKLKEEQTTIKTKVGEINTKKSLLNSEIEKFSNLEEVFSNTKKEVEKLLDKEHALDLEIVSHNKNIDVINSEKSSIEKEIEIKKKLKEDLMRLSQIQTWIDDFFINLVKNIEKHVMVKINLDFNELVQRWFSLLIEDETITIRLDDEFTPVIEQNGYETSLESLSGGEKTSVALSYRLALNKVINDLVSTIKTKDIIILDEPTDGFSTEQLDKVREVLNELNMNQIIIVSHESKVESFVDNVLRISKDSIGSSIG